MSTSRDGRNNAAKEVKFCDVGANLVSSSEVPDTVFDGFYFGSEKPYHPSDIEDVLRRARRVGVREILVTAGTAEEAKKAATRCRIWNEKSSSSDDGGVGGGGGSNNDDDEHLMPFPKMYSTVGVHPTRCDEFEKSERLSPPERYLEELKTVIRENADVWRLSGSAD